MLQRVCSPRTSLQVLQLVLAVCRRTHHLFPFTTTWNYPFRGSMLAVSWWCRRVIWWLWELPIMNERGNTQSSDDAENTWNSGIVRKIWRIVVLGTCHPFAVLRKLNMKNELVSKAPSYAMICQYCWMLLQTCDAVVQIFFKICLRRDVSTGYDTLTLKFICGSTSSFFGSVLSTGKMWMYLIFIRCRALNCSWQLPNWLNGSHMRRPGCCSFHHLQCSQIWEESIRPVPRNTRGITDLQYRKYTHDVALFLRCLSWWTFGTFVRISAVQLLPFWFNHPVIVKPVSRRRQVSTIRDHMKKRVRSCTGATRSEAYCGNGLVVLSRWVVLLFWLRYFDRRYAGVIAHTCYEVYENWSEMFSDELWPWRVLEGACWVFQCEKSSSRQRRCSWR